ncbi:hypothetical protein ANSO36C_36030 [Nostoc cf. commune SO-36]|uniref:Uncharacterized protein n=2 Tax=Nostoc commune TaxID=1178 RepID=A0ABM7Z436_NOSCO|nr:hypothetical protein ANSO36C_36030 [Nostoc cf. commune SO-36]
MSHNSIKLTKLINSAPIIAGVNSMSKIISLYIAKNQSRPSINTDGNFDIYPNYPTNVNYLKPFDTAFVAYYMMGLGNFE